MGILEVLTIVFVILKLVGIIGWSWWLVLLPSIISFTAYILIWTAFFLMPVMIGNMKK